MRLDRQATVCWKGKHFLRKLQVKTYRWKTSLDYPQRLATRGFVNFQLLFLMTDKLAIDAATGLISSGKSDEEFVASFA